VTTTGKKSLFAISSLVLHFTKLLRDAPKEIEESKRLEYHAEEGPLAKHQQDSTKEAEGPPDLLLAGKEGDSLLRADDECQTRDEEDL
jgi:hypothetical protein